MKLKHLLLPLLLLPLFCSCKTTSLSGGGGAAPAWVNSVDAVYSRTQYVAATGFASDRVMAEKNALAALVSFFGQNVQVDRTAVSYYQQAIVNGVTDSWIDTASMRNSVKTTSVMDDLFGAEVKEVWFDSRGTYYAVAVMEKARSAQIYNEVIQANLNLIKNLVTMMTAEKNTINGVIRYRFAAAAADVNVYYSGIVRLLDASVPDGIVGGDHYRLEAQNIIKIIPIGINVTNDRQGRIFGAFAKCFSAEGFESTTGNSRYMVRVNIVMSPVDLPNNPNVFARIELSANLTDTNSNIVLLPFTFNTREGHVSQAEAENRCIAAAERKIDEEFAELLSVYLSQLIPKN